MPIPTETLRNMGRLNRWFALSCLAMLASLIWAIWEDYDRPWRGIQDDYMVAQAALAHLDYLDTQTEAYQSRIETARAAVENAKAEAADKADERADLVKRQDALRAAEDANRITFGNAEALLQVTRSEFEHALSVYGPAAPQTEAVKKRVADEEAELATLRTEKERIEDGQRAVRDHLKAIDSLVVEAEKRLTKLEKVATDAQDKESQYTNIVLKSIINFPLLDFTAPKGTPARHEIRQLVLPDIRAELNYMETYTTDRCTTCHVSIDDSAFSREALARKFERSLPGINEALRRDGMDELPIPEPPVLAGEDVPELEKGKVTGFWSYLDETQKHDYFSLLCDAVNNYLTRTGRKEIRVEQPLLAHPNLELFVSVDSSHPMTKLGCTVCHEGNPQETDFVQAAHTPVGHEQEHEWAEKHYVTAAFVPNITFHTVEHHWDRLMLPPQYTEAGCAKCHSEVADIISFRGEAQAKKLNLGRDLFTRVGCINCHKVEELGEQRRVGPALTRVGAKLDSKFTDRWIHSPKEFRPSTWMPHLFLQENNGAHSANGFDPNPVLRTESEVSAISHYLFTVSQSWTPLAIPQDVTGDADRGRKLFTEVGCLACHANVKEFGKDMIVDDLVYEGRSERVAEALYDEMGYVERVSYLLENVPNDRDTVYAPESVGDQPVFTRFAPELSAVGSKLSREWIFAWLKDPKAYYPATRMPSLRLSDQEAIDITEYLLTLKANESFTPQNFPDDKAHRDMTDEMVFQLLAGQNSERRSRSIMEDDGGEMTEILVKVLSGYLGEDDARTRVGSLDAASKRKLFLGNKMIAHYGCNACHDIGGFESAPPPGTDLSRWAEKPLSQLDFAFFSTSHDHLREAKPEIYGHIYRPEDTQLIEWSRGENPEERVSHTHAAFAWHKLLNPRFWDRGKIKKPYEKLKMPNFYFTQQETDALVTYLLSRREPRVGESLKIDYDATLKGAIAEGRNLTRSLNCVGCHKIENNEAVVHQYFQREVGGEIEFDEVNAPPWLRGQGAKVNYPWFYTFLNQVETLRPWLKVRMPSFNLSEDETATLVEYFAGIAGEESGILEEHLHDVDKYLANVHAAAAADEGAPEADSWYLSDKLRATAEYLADYAVENRLVLIYDVDPAFNSAEEMAPGFEEVRKTAQFTADLFDVDFPFAEQARPVVDNNRFKRGEELFYELRCLACHVLGDPNIPGSNPNPSAPNLALAHTRLRQEWVHEWLQQPSWMQPGTKMPQLFADGNSAFAGYTEDDKALLEAKYGQTGEEQIQLLMDFVYNAGVLNYTATQPGGIAGADDGDSGDDDEGDDEDEDDEEEEEEDEEE